jgi:hypothetical protein
MQAFFRDLFCRSQSSDRIRLKGNDLSLVWNGHSCPLPLTLILDFDSDSGWVPHFSRPLQREVGFHNSQSHRSLIPAKDHRRKRERRRKDRRFSAA